jgi:archaetidylinositol phosphate synthase
MPLSGSVTIDIFRPDMERPYDQRLACVIVKPMSKANVHPNTVTVVGLVLGIASACIFAFADLALQPLAALMFILAVFVDHMDGELARMSGKISIFGYYLDYLVGAANYTFLFCGLGLAIYRETGIEFALWLGTAAGLSNLVIVSLRMHMERRFGAEAVVHPHTGGMEIEDFIYLIGPITWLGGLNYFFWVYGLGTLGYLAWTGFELLSRNRRA